MIELSPMALALVPLVIGVVQVVKGFVSDYWAPVLSLAVGIAASWLIPAETWQMTTLAGISIGLMASGTYSGARHLLR